MEDLKEQFKKSLESEFNDCWDEMDALTKFLTYKASSLKIDCDVSEKAVESYKKYAYLKGRDIIVKLQNGSNCKYEILMDNHTFRADTMTSGWWFVQQILAYYTNNEYPGVKVNGERSNLLKLREKVTIDNLKENLKVDSVEEAVVFIEALQAFLENIHSIGNMIMVPGYFNSERAGYYAVWDCWDITLHAICSWFRDNTDKKIEFDKVDTVRDKWLIKLFSKGSFDTKVCSVIECKNWLVRYFKDQFDFIEKNYLQDYCQEGYVKALMNGKIITEVDADVFFSTCQKKYKPNYGSDNRLEDMMNYMNNFVRLTMLREKRINGDE